MSIPLVSNVGFTEITQSLVDSNSGVLNDIAGTDKSKLPVQLFKLTENITGNLTLNNDSAQKKLILDTNGNNIINANGSPLTTNSSVTLELKGSGDIKSTLQSFTVTESNTGFTGTNTISELNNSTVVVGTSSAVTQHSTVTATTGGSTYSGVPAYFGTGGSAQSPGRFFSVTINGVTYSSLTSEFRQVLVDSTRSGGAWVGATVQVTGLTGGTRNATFTGAGVGQANGHAFSATGNKGANQNFSRGDIRVTIGYNDSVGWITGKFINDFGGDNDEVEFFSALGTSGTTISNLQIGQTDPGRTFTFTNNLNVNVTLSGNDPFTGSETANSGGGTAAFPVSNSSDGSFSVTASFSDTDVAIVNINDGTGSIDTSAHTGTRSTRAF